MIDANGCNNDDNGDDGVDNDVGDGVDDGVDDDVGDGVDDDDHNKKALTGRACYQCKSPAGWTHDVGMSTLSKV